MGLWDQIRAVFGGRPAGPEAPGERVVSPWKFVDDAEFWADLPNGVVQVRSASRLGEGDFGVNRERIEALRAALAAR